MAGFLVISEVFMKGIKEITKDVILAGLGTVDTQNEDIKDLMRGGPC